MNALLLAWSLLSPARAGEGCISVRPAAIRDAGMAGARTRFDLVREVQRSCGPRVRLKRLDYAVSVNGLDLTARRVDYGALSLDKGVPVEVAVPVEVDPGEALSVLASSLGTGRLQVGLSGTAKVRWFLFPLSLDLDEALVDLTLP